MRQSLPVRRLAEQALAAGATTLRVDLHLCTYLDSTFLGTLITLQRAACRLGARRFVLLSPSSNCCRHFHQLGIADVFSTEAADESGLELVWTEVACERDDACAFNRNVYQAHQELVNLGGPAAQAFGDVVRKMSREMGPNPNDTA
jgi:anti-anti-sigma regulatory factor